MRKQPAVFTTEDGMKENLRDHFLSEIKPRME
jgi:hypothetical protein